MPIFRNTDQLYEVMQELWTWIKNAPEVSDQLLKSKLIVRFNYQNPEGQLTVDGSKSGELIIIPGDCETTPDVEIFMQSDLAHEFWLGKVNVPAAMMQGKIKSKGAMGKALVLLPAIKPVYSVYPLIVERTGLNAA